MKTLQHYLTQVTTRLNTNPPFPTASGFYGVRCVSISGSNSECTKLVNELINTVTNEVFDAKDDELMDCISLSKVRNNLSIAVDNAMDFSQDVRGNQILLCWYDQEWKDDSQLESEEQ